MLDAHAIIDEISLFLDKFSLKTNTLSKEEFIDFIEKKWYEANDEKYHIRQSYIISSRMVNEYIKKKDFDNMMRWLENFYHHVDAQKNAPYIQDYYKGQCCLECGNEAKALEYFQRCYAQNPDYIFTRAPFCYTFFNQHLEHPRVLKDDQESSKEQKPLTLKLSYWQTFFQEKTDTFYFEILKSDGENAIKLNQRNKNSLAFLAANQQQILENILQALLKIYPSLQERYNYNPEEKPYFMPDITSIDGFAPLLSLGMFYLISVYKDDFAYIGFSFSCSWEQEHGLGVLIHKERVVAIDDAEMAFSINKAKEDAKH